jgi:hypothetical protein
MEIGCHLPAPGPFATPEALMAFAHQAEAYQIASFAKGSHQSIVDQYCAYKKLGLSHVVDLRRNDLSQML